MKMKVIRTRSIHSIYPYSAVATTYCTMQVSVNFIYLFRGVYFSILVYWWCLVSCGVVQLLALVFLYHNL